MEREAKDGNRDCVIGRRAVSDGIEDADNNWFRGLSRRFGYEAEVAQRWRRGTQQQISIAYSLTKRAAGGSGKVSLTCGGEIDRRWNARWVGEIKSWLLTMSVQDLILFGPVFKRVPQMKSHTYKRNNEHLYTKHHKYKHTHTHTYIYIYIYINIYIHIYIYICVCVYIYIHIYIYIYTYMYIHIQYKHFCKITFPLILIILVFIPNEIYIYIL